MKTTAKAYAKLNLTLDILGLLPNGYHNIETIFQSLSLHDTISLESGTTEISVICSSEAVPDGKDNICYTATELFFKKAGIFDGVRIEIEKNIPAAAGLGGGSADAAAVLLLLNKTYKNILTDSELYSIAAHLGADVPFCMAGGTQLGSGIGDILRPLSPCPKCDIVLVKHGTKASTAALYSRLDKSKNILHPDTAAAIIALESGELSQLSKYICNCFSAAWQDNINTQKSKLLSLGALAAELTGSGPTVFGIFPAGKGKAAAEALQKNYPQVYLCTPKNKGVEFLP